MATTAVENVICMRGNGYYNKHSGLQFAAMQAALDLLPDVSASKSLTVADYGCSQGSQSVLPLAKLTSQLQPGSDVSVILNDRPENDFSTLGATLSKARLELSQNGRVNVFPLMAPISFFNQIVPSGTVDLGLAWSSLNYLKHEAPPAEPGTDFMTAVKERAIRNAVVAHSDLVELLRLRGQEIRPGGALVVSLGARSTDGTPNMPPLIAAMRAASGALVSSGKINSEQLLALSSPAVHERTADDVKRAAEEVKDTWKLEACVQKMIEHPAHADLISAKQKATEEEAAKLSEQYADTIASWIVSAFAGMMVKALRTGKEEALSSLEETAEERELIEFFRSKTAELFLKDHRDEPVAQCYLCIKLTRV